MSLRLIVTDDGSHSLLNTEINETYHSTHGAIQESIHVFIKNGLDFIDPIKNSERVTVLEVGFGTGLNALLAMDWAQRHRVPVRYISFEAFPLDASIISEMNYPRLMEGANAADNYAAIHASPWNAVASIDPFFVLEKRLARVQELKPPGAFADIIFFDAFAPSRQPELWEMPVLMTMKDSLNVPGAFVTYCAKGQLKRDLKTMGLVVETLPGPPGKKEMVRAVKK